MTHLGKKYTSTIISKGISAGQSQNSYRGLVRISPMQITLETFQCDSLMN
jgi:Fe-S cluster assembly protein SufB